MRSGRCNRRTRMGSRKRQWPRRQVLRVRGPETYRYGSEEVQKREYRRRVTSKDTEGVIFTLNGRGRGTGPGGKRRSIKGVLSRIVCCMISNMVKQITDRRG